MTCCGRIVFCFAALHVLCVDVATAGTVTFTFEGEITSFNDFDDLLADGVTIGTPFSGRVSFDPTIVDRNPSPGVGDYPNPSVAFSGQLGEFVFSEVPLSESSISVILGSGPNSDSYLISGSTEILGEVASLILAFAGRQALSDDSLLVEPPDLALFTTARFALTIRPGREEFRGDITSLVPEPGTGLLVLLGSLGLIRHRKSARS